MLTLQREGKKEMNQEGIWRSLNFKRHMWESLETNISSTDYIFYIIVLPLCYEVMSETYPFQPTGIGSEVLSWMKQEIISLL